MPEIKLPVQNYTIGSGSGIRSSGVGFEERLGLIGDHAGGEGFHGPIRGAIASYVGTHGAEGTDPEALKTRLREVIHAADDTRHPDLSRYLSDVYLDDLIRGAVEKFGQRYVPATACAPSWSLPTITADEAFLRVSAAIREFMCEALAA